MYPDNTYISNVYNAAGYPVRVRDRMGRETSNQWDAAGHLLRVDYPNGDWVKKDYTGNLVTRVIDGRHNTTAYFYCHEQLTGVRFPDGSTRAAGFDNFNRQIWAVDERGVAVTNAYDKLDRVIASAYVPFTGEGGMPADVTSVPNTLTPSTCNWASIYGGFSNQAIHSTYDQVGNLLSLTDWAGTITNAYDALNRLITETTTYTPEGVQNPIQFNISLTHDLLNNRTFAGYYINGPGGAEWDQYYTYDALNRITHVEQSQWGSTLCRAIYVYNQNGKLAQLTTYARAGSTEYRSAQRSLSYDAEQRLNGIAVDDHYNQRVLTLDYAYNNAQQIIQINHTAPLEFISSYSSHYTAQNNYAYDQRDQLTNETVSGATTVYGYDKAQNRVMKKCGTGGSPVDAYSFTFANKLTNIYVGSTSANNRYFYDRAGNLEYRVVNSVTNWYDYNAQNKLARIRGGGFTNEFIYDSLNRRIALCQNGSWRYEAHDGQVVIAELGAGYYSPYWLSLVMRYMRVAGIAEGTGDILFELRPDSGTWLPFTYVANHRGDTVLLLNERGARQVHLDYDAFGNLLSVNQATIGYTQQGVPINAAIPRYTFSTKEYLSDAGLYLYQYRAYDPIAGRWTQRDPIDYQDSINLYQFCRNNPVNAIDPNGKVVLLVGLIATAYFVYIIGNTFRAHEVVDNRAALAVTVKLSPITLYSVDYYLLDEPARWVVDKHENWHKLGWGEVRAYKDTYARCSELLEKGQWKGRALTENETLQLKAQRETAIAELKTEMGEKEFNKWQEKTDEKRRNKKG